MRAQWFFAAWIAIGGLAAPASAQDIAKTNCDVNEAWRYVSKEAEGAVSPGPFRLIALHCQTLGNAGPPGTAMPFTPIEPVIVSPDISRIASQNAHDHYNRGIAVAPLSEPRVNVVHRDALDFFWGWIARSNKPQKAIRWSADSRTLWSAMQERATCPCPGSWAAKPAVGPVRPIAIENGTVRELPTMTHPAGTLDALLWAEDGRALVLFGAHGGAYRPEVPNPNPTIAFVDAARGRVIESLPLQAVVTGAGRPDTRLAYDIVAAEIVGLRDGRLRAFLRTGQSWVVWTQASPPRVLPDPYPMQDQSNREIETAISPDGSRLLIVRQYHRVGRNCVDPYHGPCSPGPSLDGVLAAYHDLETGRAIWTYRVRITVPGIGWYPTPALSDDGRYALIGLPPSDSTDQNSVALVSTSDGSVQQQFRGGSKIAIGFGRGSRQLWIHDRGLTAVYALQ
jgi:hypothetical protein